VEALLQAAALYGYVQKHSIDQQLIGWRLNAGALDWCLPEDSFLAGIRAPINSSVRSI
jgi:hypothetical protein